MTKVSVSIVTYNHEHFISQAIQSALMQKTNFEYEIIIGEDDSSDRTREIVQAYAARYPEKIRLFLNDRKNVIYIDGRPTGRWNFVNNLKHAQGQYVALLEGDDYWTDPNKLQKQVDFLDARPDFAICYHPAGWLDQESGQIEHWKYGVLCSGAKPYYTVDDLLAYGNFIPTCSVMFANGLFGDIPDWYYRAGVGDFPLHVLNTMHGKIGFLEEPMAVYRCHKGSLYAGRPTTESRRAVVETYLLMASTPHLGKRASFRIGLARHKLSLCRAYAQHGSQVDALVTAYSACRSAPISQKISTALRVVLILFPSSRALARLALKLLRRPRTGRSSHPVTHTPDMC